jgi:hypothetical protein
MSALVQFVTLNYAQIITVLFLTSELLASIPVVKANSVFQLLFNLFKSEAKKEVTTITNDINK